MCRVWIKIRVIPPWAATNTKENYSSLFLETMLFNRKEPSTARQLKGAVITEGCYCVRTPVCACMLPVILSCPTCTRQFWCKLNHIVDKYKLWSTTIYYSTVHIHLAHIMGEYRALWNSTMWLFAHKKWPFNVIFTYYPR